MKAIKRNLAILLAACMVITSVVPAFAEEIPEQQTETVNEIVPEGATPNEATYGSEAADPENEDIEKASLSDAKKSDSEVFISEATVDGVIVKVEAPAGTFPADAELSVTAVDEDTVDENIENVEEKIDEAVEAARKKDKDLKDAKVLSSLKFDIKIVLPDGTELQPEGNKVKVTFTLAEKVGDCVDINVYHLKEVENTGNAADTEESDVSLKAEKVEGTVKTVPALETAETAEGTTAVNVVSEEVDEEGVLADGPITNDVNDEVSEFEGETDGFSYYTVEFTYEELQYVLPGDSSIALSDILAQLKIEGTVADVEVSSPELFSADKDANGVWTVTAHQAFSSTEWMKVTMEDGQVYEIVVTDNATRSFAELQDLIDAIETGGTLKLESDYSAASENTPISIASEKVITIDLNGHVINGRINEDTSVGSVIIVNGTLTLEDSGSTVEHTGYVDENGLWHYGSGGKNENITGGIITGGTGYKEGTTSRGGGVLIESDGELKMKGGTIAGNSASAGGGVNVNNSGRFTMSGKSRIEKNYSSANGGGVYNKGTLKIEKDSKIVGNRGISGGGIYLAGGECSLSGGAVEGNIASNGGGVLIYGGNLGNFTMTGGIIEENQAETVGGGIYLVTGTLTLGGTAKITGNKLSGGPTNNVYLASDKYIAVGDGEDVPVLNGMEIGVTTYDDSKGEFITSNPADQYINCFTADNKEYGITVADDLRLKITKKKAKEVSAWQDLQNEIDSADTPTIIKLNAEITALSTNSAISIPSKKDITLDLNGHTIDRDLAEAKSGGNVITVKSGARLTIEDNSDGKTGKITGGNTTGNGSGVNIEANGTFTLKGGSIKDNEINNDHGNGGGVYVGGTFIMTGGSITNNRANGSSTSGGGVYVGGTFTMTGGSITGNNAYKGGGVFNNGNSQIVFKMTGGSITNNTAKASGGGVNINGDKWEVTVGGNAKITGNTAGAEESKVENNVYLPSGNKYITIGTDNDKPINGMKIGVTTGTAPTEKIPCRITTNGTANDTVYFTSDNDAYEVKFNGNYLELAVKTTPSHTHTFTYAASNNKLTATCTAGCDEGYDKNPLTLTLTAPKNLIYDGTPKGVAFTDAESLSWMYAVGELPGIDYYIKSSGQSGYEPMEGWPTDAGDYKAQTTGYDATAELEFAIEKAASESFIVTFIYRNGQVNKEVKVPYNKKVAKPADPAMTGYTFDAWCSDNECRIEYDFSKPVTSNLSLYARWKKNAGTENSSSGTNSIYTGTTSYPVSDGKWIQNADGTWSYVAGRRFTSTWGYIANSAEGGKANWYYFDSYSRMLVGWQKLYWNGAYRWFYFSKKNDGTYGACQLGGVTPDGYRVGADGAWIEK